MKQYVNRWTLLARLGYMYATDRQKAFTETNVGQTNSNMGSLNTSLNNLNLRLQAGYRASHTVEPYAFLTYGRDFGASKIRGIPSASGGGVDNSRQCWARRGVC